MDLSAYPLDGPLPPLPDVSTCDRQRTNLERLEAFAKENLTIREIARRVSNAGTGPIMAGLQRKSPMRWRPGIEREQRMAST